MILGIFRHACSSMRTKATSRFMCTRGRGRSNASTGLTLMILISWKRTRSTSVQGIDARFEESSSTISTILLASGTSFKGDG